MDAGVCHDWDSVVFDTTDVYAKHFFVCNQLIIMAVSGIQDEFYDVHSVDLDTGGIKHYQQLDGGGLVCHSPALTIHYTSLEGKYLTRLDTPPRITLKSKFKLHLNQSFTSWRCVCVCVCSPPG